MPLPIFQSAINSAWRFTPKPPQSFTYFLGDANPDNINIHIDFPIFSIMFPEYDGFQLQISLLGGNGQGFFVELLGYDFGEKINITQNYLDLTLILKRFTEIQSIVEGGSYNERDYGVRFKVFGKYNNGPSVDTGYFEDYSVNGIVANDDYAYAEPKELNFVYKIGGASVTAKDLQIKAKKHWRLKSPNNFVVSGGDDYYMDGNGNYNSTGNGNKTLHVRPNTTVGNGVPGIYDFELTLYDNLNEITQTIIVHVYVIDDDIAFFPDKFYFEGIQNIDYPQPQELLIVSIHSFTITTQDFTTVSESAGSDILPLWVSVPHPETLSIDEHTDHIVVNSNGQEYLIPVTYNVSGLLSSDFQNHINFTKEEKYCGIYVPFDHLAIAHINLSLSQEGDTRFLEFEMPFHKQEGKFPLGLEVHRMFKPFSYKDIMSQPGDYKTYPEPLNVKCEIKVVDAADNSSFGSDSFSTLFFKGQKPRTLNNDRAILEYDYVTQRVTPSGKGIINVTFSKYHVLYIVPFKNGTQYHPGWSYDMHKNSSVALPIDFADCAPGDTISFYAVDETTYLNQGGANSPLGLGFFTKLVKTYVVFPETPISYHIAWINECNVIDMMQCTGAIKFDTDYDHQTFETTNGFVDKLKNLENKKTPTVTVNTGFITKSSVRLLDSIFSTEKAWLILHNGQQEIEMVPKSKKLEGYDSEKDLYSYDIEFVLNPKTDAEVYTY